MRTFFTRSGWSLPVTLNKADYIPGDLVTCTVPPNLPHIMIVSDKRNASGIPLVIHNIGAGVQEEDRLFEFDLTGHYRIPASDPETQIHPNPEDVSVSRPDSRYEIP